MPRLASDSCGAQMLGTPVRRHYSGTNLNRAISIDDLRAMTHTRMPRFVLEYLEGGAEDEATLLRERAAYADWRFTPRQLVDVRCWTLPCIRGGSPRRCCANAACRCSGT
jgi:(S)-mandelate dehydrogenase